MGTIDTIRFQDQSVRVGLYTFDGMDRVPFRVWLKVMAAMVAAKLEKRRTRQNLTKLSVQQLHDIGITQEQADYEIRKSFPLYERVR